MSEHGLHDLLDHDRAHHYGQPTLEEIGGTYGYGGFKGSDGERYVGIAEDELD